MKILSMFTGGGGLDIGFHGNFDFLGKFYPELGFHTEVALDLNKFACNTISSNKKYFEKTNVINTNILSFEPSSILGEFDVLVGGFPCVTFSMIGNRTGITDDINGKLYERYASFVEHFKPKVFLAENVKGMLSANKGQALKIINERFAAAGYKMKIFVVNFADFGVPQTRERVLFIGVRNDIEYEFQAPAYTTYKEHISSSEAFLNILPSAANNELLKTTASTIEKINAIPEGGNFKDLPEHLAIKAQMSNVYRRLHRHKPAYTVLASGGGGTWSYHYEEPRPLTNRERARLQSFPDDLIFSGSTTEVRRQIGNAVPPVGIYHFAKKIKELLEGKEIIEKNSISCYNIK